ncbi:hypothetical protein J437_LFUL008806 [Ladona fulva]|uniref:Protein Wnt n=1 Tax=Ladona fulva TaxID=123851 RepID=A0A8K0K8J4_LADFU|nr:hypothetical protein J437_LFUL008806 [Ladona fulva]
MKTCWRAAPEFRRVGDALSRRYRSAVLVADANLGRGFPLLLTAVTEAPAPDDEDDEGGSEDEDEEDAEERLRRAQPHPEDLLYFEKSPNFCEVSSVAPGTSGRKCVAGRRRPRKKRREGSKEAEDEDSCSSLCCGRGYNVVRQRRTERCGCRFQWCCNVVCSNCTREEWVTVCK